MQLVQALIHGGSVWFNDDHRSKMVYNDDHISKDCNSNQQKQVLHENCTIINIKKNKRIQFIIKLFTIYDYKKRTTWHIHLEYTNTSQVWALIISPEMPKCNQVQLGAGLLLHS